MTIIRHVKRNGHWRSNAWKDHLPHPNGTFQSEAYVCGDLPAHYPVPAIPTQVEYVFGYGLADGIFIRVNGTIEAGAYRDGMLCIIPYTVG